VILTDVESGTLPGVMVDANWVFIIRSKHSDSFGLCSIAV
jgi:hypothetical protein